MGFINGVKTVFPDGLRYIKQNMKEYKVSVFVGVPVLTGIIDYEMKEENDNEKNRFYFT